MINDTPTDIALSANTVAEVAAAGTVIGTLSATDADTPLGDTATFSIVDSDGRFNIVGGELVVLDGTLLDFENADSHSVTIRVTDAHGATYDKALTVSLTDVNDNPPVITTSASLSVAENATVVAALASTDADGVGTNPATFSIVGGADQALFGISGGNLVFLNARDYETQAHSYQVTVRASDGVNNTDKAITVSLTDVNETPAFTSGTIATVVENTAASVVVYDANASDPEGATITYALAGKDATRFTINSATGEVRFVASPDYENPTDAGANNAYNFIVRASDGIKITDRAVTLSVTDVGEGHPSRDADAISGGPGADILNGGLGNDILTGKGGPDLFAFDTKLNSKKNVDHITDYEIGIDTIQLDRSIFKGLKVGDLNAKAFTSGKVKSDDRIIYDKKNGDLFFDVDGRGGKKAVKFAILDNHPDKLSADDFTIVA